MITNSYNPVFTGVKDLKWLQKCIKSAAADPGLLEEEVRIGRFKELTRDEFNSVKDLVEQAKGKAVFDGDIKSIDESMEMLREKVFGQ